MQDLAGSVVAITGASSGIGAATAKTLGALGAKVVIGARRPQRLKELAEELGSNAIPVEMDVRSSEEFDGELGHLEGSHLIPLDELRDRTNEIPKDKPVVAVCQSGKRSGMATQILLQAGFDRVANVPGGLIHWSRLALPFRDR